MKSLLTLFFLLFSLLSIGQVFSFIDTNTTLTKNVNQSPAHWYLEVENLIGVDTTLRWKCTEITGPTQWVFSFDDQDNYYSLVELGDSADFTLFDSLSFPQKLIIGNTFNGMHGNGQIKFIVYNPETPNDFQEISYRFIVSQVNGLEESLMDFVQFDQNEISVVAKKDAYITLFDMTGRQIANSKSRINASNLTPGSYIISLSVGAEVHSFKWVKR